MLLDEIVQMKTDEIERDEPDLEEKDYARELEAFIKSWEKAFDFINSEPWENSDFDSDNEINPLDTLDSLGRYISSSSAKQPGQQIQADNKMKKKPIQLTVIGKPNVGKSTLVNQLLEESRVIANDLEGTTRDAVRVQWIYGGRRVTLVDTAGIKSLKKTTKGKDAVDILVEEEVQKCI